MCLAKACREQGQLYFISFHKVRLLRHLRAVTTHLLHITAVLAARPDHQHQVDADAAADEHQHGEVVPQLGAQVGVGGREVDRVGRHGEVAPEGRQVVAQAVGVSCIGERAYLK